MGIFMKKASRLVKESRERAGIMPTSLGFTEEQKAKLDAFAAELGLGRVAAIMEAIDGYNLNTISKARLMAELQKRLK
jgi:predicted DNA-binding protein